MWEFEYLDTLTHQQDFIYGRSWEDALRRYRMDNSCGRYKQLFAEFID